MSKLHYYADGGMRRWERAEHVEEGLDQLLEWIGRNKDAVLTLEVTYDPGKVQPDRLEAWVWTDNNQWEKSDD